MVCSFEGCGGKRKALGLCWAHYAQQRRGQELRPLLPYRGPRGGRRRTSPSCSFPECGRPNNGGGLCAAHRAQKKQGGPLVPVGAAKRWWWPIESA